MAAVNPVSSLIPTGASAGGALVTAAFAQKIEEPAEYVFASPSAANPELFAFDYVESSLEELDYIESRGQKAVAAANADAAPISLVTKAFENLALSSSEQAVASKTAASERAAARKQAALAKKQEAEVQRVAILKPAQYKADSALIAEIQENAAANSYGKRVLRALQSSGADMRRHDIIKYLIDEKINLFTYYHIQIVLPEDTKEYHETPFVYNGPYGVKHLLFELGSGYSDIATFEWILQGKLHRTYRAIKMPEPKFFSWSPEAGLRSKLTTTYAEKAATVASVAEKEASNASLDTDERRMLIEFKDGNFEIFDMLKLQKIAFFKTLYQTKFSENRAGKLRFSQISLSQFKTIYSLLVEKKPFFESISTEQRRDPYFIDTLVQLIDFLNPGEAENRQIIESLTQRLQLLLSPQDAEELIKNYGDQSSAAGCQKEPFLVVKAKSIFIQSKTFSSDSIANAYFTELYNTEIEREKAEWAIADLEEELSKSTAANGAAPQEQIKLLKGLVALFTKKIEGLQKKNNRLRIKKIDLVNLSLHSDHPSQVIKFAAAGAFSEIAAYKSKMTRFLQMFDAEHFLPYLCGPKAFLFDHYEIEFQVTAGGPALGLLHVPSNKPINFNFKNSDVYQFEDEVRSTLQMLGVPEYTLPDQCVQERVFTKPQSEEVMRFREGILPILKIWERIPFFDQTIIGATITAEQKRGEELIASTKKQVIDYFKWTHITPDDIRLSPDRLNEERLTIAFRDNVCGRRATSEIDSFYGRRYGEDGIAPSFDFNLWDCKTVYVSKSYHSALQWHIQKETVEDMPSTLRGLLDSNYTYTQALIKQSVPKRAWRG